MSHVFFEVLNTAMLYTKHTKHGQQANLKVTYDSIKKPQTFVFFEWLLAVSHNVCKATDKT